MLGSLPAQALRQAPPANGAMTGWRGLASAESFAAEAVSRGRPFPEASLTNWKFKPASE